MRSSAAPSIVVPVLLATLAGCATPAPTATPGPTAGTERCVDLAATQAVGLAWSQTGSFLAVGTVGPDGSPGLRVVEADRVVVSEPLHDPDVLPSTVAITPDGRLAWLEERGAGRVLVEARDGGLVETALPPGIDGLAWTAIGFALLQHPPEGGSRVLILDVDRPQEPTVTYETGLRVERLWISADPEHMVLTISHPDHRDAPASFDVVGASTTHHLEPEAADATGASMPSLRRWVVYRSASTSLMTAVRVADPSRVVPLSARPSARGMVSDRGVLAFVPVEPYGQLCLLDVAALLP